MVRLLSGSRATVQLFAWLWSGPGLAVRCVCQAVPVLHLMAVWSGLLSGLVAWSWSDYRSGPGPGPACSGAERSVACIATRIAFLTKPTRGGIDNIYE